MESGNIVEYIDRQKIMCAVVLEVKNQRLRLLTESNREVNLSVNRLAHTCESRIDLSMGRHKMVDALKEIVGRRKALISYVDIKELWEVLNTEQEWIDLNLQWSGPSLKTGFILNFSVIGFTQTPKIKSNEKLPMKKKLPEGIVSFKMEETGWQA